MAYRFTCVATYLVFFLHCYIAGILMIFYAVLIFSVTELINGLVICAARILRSEVPTFITGL